MTVSTIFDCIYRMPAVYRLSGGLAGLQLNGRLWCGPGQHPVSHSGMYVFVTATVER